MINKIIHNWSFSVHGTISHTGYKLLDKRVLALFCLCVLAVPLIRGYYELYRTKSFHNLHNFTPSRKIRDVYILGLNELFSSHSARQIEKMSPRNVSNLPFYKLTDYQLTVFASRTELFERLTLEQRQYLCHHPAINASNLFQREIPARRAPERPSASVPTTPARARPFERLTDAEIEALMGRTLASREPASSPVRPRLTTLRRRPEAARPVAPIVRVPALTENSHLRQAHMFFRLQQHDFANMNEEESCWVVRVRREDLERDPIGVINSFTEMRGQKPHPTRLRVVFLKSDGSAMEGVDAGGLRREFVSSVSTHLKSVASRGADGILIKIEENLPVAALSKWSRYYFLDEDGVESLTEIQLREMLEVCSANFTGSDINEIKGRYEYFRRHLKPLAPPELQIYKNLGALLSIGFHQNLPTGSLFCEAFYKALQEFTFQELQTEFTELLPFSLLRVYRQLMSENAQTKMMFSLRESTPQKLKDRGEWKLDLRFWAYPLGEFPEYFSTLDQLEENYELFQQAIETQLYCEARANRSLPAIHAIGSALDETTLQAFKESQAMLMLQVQGQLSKDLVIARLDGPANLKSLMTRWITEATDEQVTHFVWAVTGARSLGTNLRIILRSMPSLDETFFPVFHTCFATVDLPHYARYETFRARLNESIAQGLEQGFALC